MISSPSLLVSFKWKVMEDVGESSTVLRAMSWTARCGASKAEEGMEVIVLVKGEDSVRRIGFDLVSCWILKESVWWK